MGYDLHVTRTEEWSDNDDAPISYAEWQGLAESHPGLTAAGSVTFGADTQPVYQLRTLENNSPSLYWFAGNVDIAGADESTVPLLIPIATALRGRLQGDDGELYD